MIYQVENMRLQTWESLVLRYALLVICQVEMDMVNFRDIHLERSSYLVHNYFFLSLGPASEVPKLTNYGMVLFQTRA